MNQQKLFRSVKGFNTYELWVIVFILGIVAYNPPFITIFDKSVHEGGIPPLFVYLYSAWAIHIFLIFLLSRFISHQKH